MKTFALVAVLLSQNLEVRKGQLELGDAGVPQSTLDQWADAGAERLVISRRGLVLVPDVDAGVFLEVEVGPGCYSPTPACMAVGQRLAQLGGENVELKRVPPGVRPQIVAASIGFVLGVLAGVFAIGAACDVATGNVLCRK